jgi:tellurite resistance-related uncharacterized protein
MNELNFSSNANGSEPSDWPINLNNVVQLPTRKMLNSMASIRCTCRALCSQLAVFSKELTPQYIQVKIAKRTESYISLILRASAVVALKLLIEKAQSQAQANHIESPHPLTPPQHHSVDDSPITHSHRFLSPVTEST